MTTCPGGTDLLDAIQLRIAQSLPADLIRVFPLGWSHYVELLTIDSPDERRFYEIEAATFSLSPFPFSLRYFAKYEVHCQNRGAFGDGGSK
jgi:hypothetical protein